MAKRFVITPKVIEGLLTAINKLDTDPYVQDLWQYDYWQNEGYYFSRGHENPVNWTNGRLKPSEAYIFLSGILMALWNDKQDRLHSRGKYTNKPCEYTDQDMLDMGLNLDS